MLANSKAVATIAVRDLEKARPFYEDTLGLPLESREGEEVLVFRTGGVPLFVYRSAFAGTNRATSATWTVEEDVESLAATLKEKGVRFEHYDMPGLTLRGDVHVGDGMKVAWFKDPDGNILSIVNG